MDITIKSGLGLMEMRVLPTDYSLNPEEVRWVAKACTGDETAYRWLMERYRVRAVRLAAHVLRRESEAEDIAQEAFLQAFRQLRTLKDPDRFAPWLFQIVVRLCLSQKRLKRWSSEDPLKDIAPTQRRSVSSEVLNKIVVEQLLDLLSPPIRAALVLRELEGLEYEEIALVLQIPVGTVRSRLSTARSQFRELWNTLEVEDGQPR